MKTVVIGMVGVQLDRGAGAGRWDNWRPSVDLCRHPEFVVDRFELLHSSSQLPLAQVIQKDIGLVSPETEMRLHAVDIASPWDFEEVYAAFHDFARSYRFRRDEEKYLVHVTTGTHVMQICLFLLTETRHFPAQLLQASPPSTRRRSEPGSFSIIDLDLSKYDRIASRFKKEKHEGTAFLKSGIATRSPSFNALIDRIEQVAVASRAPLLLTGPTGAGKSHLARRIFELRHSRLKLEGAFIEVNCATLRGDGAMSTLFGHVKGAFTGALKDRPGLLRAADRGLLFLDEVGELGLDEQAMLLRAIEERSFLPLGADEPSSSDFQLICGTNRDLHRAVREGRFREDLLARINLWAFHLPSLRERREDLEPNLDYELDRWAEVSGQRVTFNREARNAFLAFATSPAATWQGNFRDFNAALMRMATLAEGGRIGVAGVREEMARLQSGWSGGTAPEDGHDLPALLPDTRLGPLDRFDEVQLTEVVRVCKRSGSLSDAGRQLFSVSRAKKQSSNDADRLRKYLARFGLSWSDVSVPLPSRRT